MATADLTTVSYRSINGQSVVAVAESTLAAGASMVDAWHQLEPLVRTLTKRVGASLKSHKRTPAEDAKLLSLCATVIHRVGGAAQGVLRATEGQAKLAVLLQAGQAPRKAASQLTEKQLAGVVLEAAKRIVEKTGRCPVCMPIAVSAKVTPHHDG